LKQDDPHVKEFKEKVSDCQISMATFQGYFMKNRDDPVTALNDVDQLWNKQQPQNN